MNILQQLQEYEQQGLVYSQRHPTLPLSIWNYSAECQYSKAWDDVTKMCRGLVVHDDGYIISKGFDKFWNFEEGMHTPTDDFEVFDKADGQYIGCFWYNGEMVVNSRGSFTSKYAIEAKRILDEKYHKFVRYMTTSPANKDYSFVFELIGFEQIVVNYSEPNLILTGAMRHCRYESLFDYWDDVSVGYEGEHFINSLGLEKVKKYSGLDYTQIKQLNWKNSEGFVVRFSNGQRCKIKFEDYIQLHRQMTNLSTTAIWESLRDGRPVSEILNDVPDEFYDKVHLYENDFKAKYKEIEDLSICYFDYFKPLLLHRRKLFAERVNSLLINPYKSIVLAMIDGVDYSELIWNAIKPKFEKI